MSDEIKNIAEQMGKAKDFLALVQSGGGNYEQYMGRWSRQNAPRFIDWLGPAADLVWLDVGCGAGGLSMI